MIIVCPEKVMELITHFYQGVVAVSITGHGRPSPLEHSQFSENISDVLPVCFDDEVDERYGSILTKGQARNILDFADEHRDLIFSENQMFFIHCRAGISRSVAVAKAIADIFSSENKNFWNISDLWNHEISYYPNDWVYEIMIGEDGKYEKEAKMVEVVRLSFEKDWSWLSLVVNNAHFLKCIEDEKLSGRNFEIPYGTLEITDQVLESESRIRNDMLRKMGV